jgi:hypothetical protein
MLEVSNYQILGMGYKMKFRTFPTILILLIISAVDCHAVQSITVSRPIYDFGTIPQGQKVEHVFIVKNSGDIPLSIKGIRPSCGCTAAQASVRVIQPGKTSEIRVTFNSANFFGAIHKTIAVESDDPKAPVSTLSLKGSVIEEITINPRQINLGVLKSGSSKEIAITVGNNSKQIVRVLSVKSPMPQITVKQNASVIKPGETVIINVSATPQRSDRMLSGYVSIMTDNPTKTEIIVPVYASVAN